jgi:hypothetical protein
VAGRKWLEGTAEMGMDKTLDFIMRSTAESRIAFLITSVREGVSETGIEEFHGTWASSVVLRFTSSA